MSRMKRTKRNLTRMVREWMSRMKRRKRNLTRMVREWMSAEGVAHEEEEAELDEDGKGVNVAHEEEEAELNEDGKGWNMMSRMRRKKRNLTRMVRKWMSAEDVALEEEEAEGPNLMRMVRPKGWNMMVARMWC
jgi:hypothetical protein